MINCLDKLELVANTPKARLGEGAVWHPVEQVLYWVDITEGKLHCYNPANEENQTFSMGSMIGTVVPAKGRFNVLVALETGIYGRALDGEMFKLADYPREVANNRFNDGKCDPKGRFWVGTMNKKVIDGAGALYLFDGHQLAIKRSGMTIPNGVVWSSDGQTMYHVDTAESAVFAYDFNLESGALSRRRIAIKVPQELGVPDGMSIDSADMLWIAHWGGKAVVQWNPLTGEKGRVIDVPAPHVTSCAFGGENLKTLYITTAQEGLTDKQLREYPLSGSLFKIPIDVEGTYSGIYGE
ncbi:MAG: SMP-30/gluconolactonase/LRE family protein [Bacteroidales bacterium]